MKLPQLLIFLFLLFATITTRSQIGIGTITPDASAQLDITSTNKGLLPPRLTFAQQNAIISPATGLILFNTTSNRLTYNIGTTSTPVWEAVLGTTSGWSTTGNSNIIDGTNFIGTTGNVSLRFRTNNLTRVTIDSLGHVGVGTLTPTQKFHVVGTDTATSVIAASTTVLGQYENTNTGSTCIDLKTSNTSGHTLSTRIGINPTYTSTGGTGVMAWYANYDGNYRILHCYDYVNNNYLIAPSIPGYTVNNVGVGTVSPTSSFDINGSFAAAIATVTTSTLLDGTYYTVIITGGSPTITFPAAATCARRIYVIVNQSGGTRTVSSYKNLSGTNTTTVTNGSSIMIQSNGTNWYQIK